MQLTHYTDYALRVLIYLSLQEKDQRVTINDISEHFEIPRNHLVKVVHRLGQLHYIKTVRGKNGGITLAEHANTLRIGDVVRNMEAKLDIVDCSLPSACPILPQCKLKNVLNEARDAFLQVLDHYTLQDLLHRPEQLKNLLHFYKIAAVEI